MQIMQMYSNFEESPLNSTLFGLFICSDPCMWVLNAA